MKKLTQLEWDRRAQGAGFIWLEPVSQSTVRTQARCLNGQHEFAIIPSTASRGCPLCKNPANRKRLSTEEIDEVFFSAGFDPLEPYAGKDVLRFSRCRHCGREFGVRYSHVRDGGGCAYCSGKRLDPEEVEAVFTQAGLEPLEPYAKNTRPRRCRCKKCGRETAPTFSNLKKGTGGCKYCAGRAVVLAEVDEAFAAASLQPLEDYAGADAPRRCRCTNCGGIISPSWTSVKQGIGCAYCAGRRVTHDGVDQIFSDAELEPLEPYVNAKTRRRSRCLRCGTVVFPTYDNLKQGQGGCASCAEFGFNPTLPSILYLLEADEDSALKIGIAKRSDLARGQARLDAHSVRGWHTVRVWELATGEQAREIEQGTLRWWRDDLGLPPARKRGSGFTETVSAEHMTIRRVVRHVNKRLREMSIRDSPVRRISSAAIVVSEKR
jgi:hypothetical protein